eukprot:s3229_g1.t1
MLKAEPAEPFSIGAVRAEVFNELADMRVGWTLNPEGAASGQRYGNYYQDPALACGIAPVAPEDDVVDVDILRFASGHGAAPYKLVYQKAYQGRMTEFAAHTALKGNPKWQRGIVLVKTEAHDTYVVCIGTSVMLTRRYLQLRGVSIELMKVKRILTMCRNVQSWISQMMQRNEAMIRTVKVGADEFAKLDDYGQELDLCNDVPKDDFWCDEDEVKFNSVPDAL